MVPVNFVSFYDSTPNSLSPLNRTISCLGAPSILASTNDFTSLCSNERRLYRTFEITRPIFSNLLLSSPPRPHSTFLNASTPVFYVKNNGYPQYGPSVTLTDKTRDGEVLGFVKSRWGRSDLFGLGPCATFITWQKLRRASYTSYSRFEFVFNFGPTGGGRRKFIWRCQFLGGFNDQPNMVLHEIVGWGVRGFWGRESPELLAIYDGMQGIGLRTERKGKLRIKRGVTRGEEELFHDPEEKEEDPEGDWEKVVILTAMAIVEATRRWYSKGSDPTERKP